MAIDGVYGRELKIHDVVFTGHNSWEPTITVVGFEPDPDGDPEYFYIRDQHDETHIYRVDEWVAIGPRVSIDDLASFRELVREIVHAGPNDSDADVLALLEKDHLHRSEELGCIGCE